MSVLQYSLIVTWKEQLPWFQRRLSDGGVVVVLRGEVVAREAKVVRMAVVM